MSNQGPDEKSLRGALDSLTGSGESPEPSTDPALESVKLPEPIAIHLANLEAIRASRPNGPSSASDSGSVSET